jgi:hypothetical protein
MSMSGIKPFLAENMFALGEIFPKRKIPENIEIPEVFPTGRV